MKFRFFAFDFGHFYLEWKPDLIDLSKIIQNWPCLYGLSQWFYFYSIDRKDVWFSLNTYQIKVSVIFPSLKPYPGYNRREISYLDSFATCL